MTALSPRCHSRVARLAEGAGLVLRVRALLGWCHLQVTRDVDLRGGDTAGATVGPAGGLGTPGCPQGVPEGYQTARVTGEAEGVDLEAQHVLPGTGGDKGRAGGIGAPVHQAAVGTAGSHPWLVPWCPQVTQGRDKGSALPGWASDPHMSPNVPKCPKMSSNIPSAPVEFSDVVMGQDKVPSSP